MKLFLPASAFRVLAAIILIAAFTLPVHAQRQMEKLGRGVIVLHKSSTQAYVSWRQLATDPDGAGYNVLRSASGAAPVQINASLVTNTTDFLDTTADFTVSNAWFIQPVFIGVTQALSAPWGLAANPPVRQYFAVPLHVTGGAAAPYDVKFCWVGDVDGDGEYDFVVDRMSTTVATNEYLQAYKRDGTFLWQMDMGYNSTNQYNIEPGASAISIGDKDNVTMYDFDGSGRAQVAVRTARGVILPDGSTITGPDDTTQYISILDGLTGKELARTTLTNMWPADGPLNCHFGVIYCDGVHPSLFIEGENRNVSKAFQRESMAFDYRNGQLTRRWFWTQPANSNFAWGHQIRFADVNHDGIDDIIEVGSANSGADGQPLFDTELGHGDRYHISDMDPDRPGLETYSIQQLNSTLLATMLYDSGSGKIIKKWYAPNVVDVGRGVALAMDPNRKGYEMYSTQPGIYDCKGNQIYANNLWAPETVWWDADLTREFEDGAGSGALSPVVNKFDPVSGTAFRLQTLYNDNGGIHQAYGGRAAFWGDIFGDWREELVLVANDYSEIRIYSTTISATNKIYCLMQNPQYRDQCTAKGYYQSSYPDYYLGPGMQPPAIPPVSNAKLTWRGNAGTNWDAGSTANWFTNNLWISNNTAVAFNPGDTVLFDISGSNNAVNLIGSLQPGTVTVHSPKDYSFNGGSLDGAMPFTKAGAGKLIFNNTNSYSGRTLICESPFLVNGALANSPVTVRGGIWLDGRLGGSGVVGSPVSCEPGGGISPGQGTNSPGTLTIANSLTLNNALNDFDLSDDVTGVTKTNDLLIVTGTLSLLGTNTLTIHKLNSTLPPGIYPLINYGALSGSLNNFTVAGLDGTPLALTNPPGQIALVVKSVRATASLVWNGGQNGNAWDLVTTSNFLNGAAQDFFVPQDNVVFTDAGGANSNVNLSATLLAASVTVNAGSNYFFTGSGGISGGTGLTKTNAGTLVINNDNYYTGRTLVGGGVLEVNDLSVANSPGPLGSAPSASPTNLVIFGGATLRINSTQAYTDRGTTLQSGTNIFDVPTYGALVNFSGLVTGAGALQKIGQGTLILGTSNSFSGGVIAKAGVVQLATEAGNTYGVGTGTVTLDGGILKMLDDSSTYSTMAYNIFVPTNSGGELDCDSRIDCYGTLTGGGTLKMCIPFVRTTLYGNWSAFTGKINVLPGNAGDPRTGGTGTNGDFRISNSFGYGNCAIYLTNWMYAYHTTANTTVAVGELSGGPNSVLSAGAWQVGAKNTDATFAGRITGNSITKVDTGAWTLTGSNNYTGTTTVNAGTLFINGDNHSATAGVTINSAGTLGGKGIVGGATTVNGKLSPGPNFATLSFSNGLTLAVASTTLIEISKTPRTNDAFVVSGSLNLNGALVVTNLAGTPALGDSFKLFNAAAPAGNFSSVTLPPLVTGLAWNKTALASSGIITVVSNTPPTIGKTILRSGTFVLSGSNGVPGNIYYIVGTTNLALPLANWTRLATNVFDAGGNFGWTNTVGTSSSLNFFSLLVP